MDNAMIKKVIEVFRPELELIDNPAVVQFVVYCFDNLCPKYFWKVPASSTGKYHPKISSGEGGLVRHTKLAVRFGKAFIEAWPMNVQHSLKDEIIAALLLHDMLKLGETENPLDTFRSYQHYVKGHGIYCAERIRQDLEFRKPKLSLSQDSIENILEGIQGHMGKWTYGFEIDKILSIKISPENTTSIIAATAYLADFAASQKIDDWLKDIA